MNIKSINEMRCKVLSEIEKEFVEELVPAKFSDSDESVVPVLTVMLGGQDADLGNAMGEFFFMESLPRDEIQYFISLITLYENIPEENLDELTTAISMINTYVPVGGFCLDPGTGSLVYKYSYPMVTIAPYETVRDGVDMAMGCALTTVSEMGYLLAEVCDGERSAESVIDILNGEEDTGEE